MDWECKLPSFGCKGESLQQSPTQLSPKAHIWELEKRRADNPSMSPSTRLADHFGVSVASLVGEDSAGETPIRPLPNASSGGRA
jgi:hypothetical protein